MIETTSNNKNDIILEMIKDNKINSKDYFIGMNQLVAENAGYKNLSKVNGFEIRLSNLYPIGNIYFHPYPKTDLLPYKPSL